MLTEVEVSKIKENPYQPRFMKPFSEITKEELLGDRELVSLANSIAKNGLQQPISLMHDDGDSYIVVFGHRRVLAHILLGREKITADVKEASAKDIRTSAIVENLLRKNLSPIETAKAFKDAIDSGDYKTPEELAAQLGVRPIEVYRHLKMLTLHQDILDDLRVNQSAKKDKVLLYELANIEPKKQMNIYSAFQQGKMDRDGAIMIIKEIKGKSNKNIVELKKNVHLRYDKQGVKMRADFLKDMTDDDRKRFEEQLGALVEGFVKRESVS